MSYLHTFSHTKQGNTLCLPLLNALCSKLLIIFVYLYSIGLIGPEFSEESKAVSTILSSVSGAEMLLQIGFSSTAVELSDREQYPNFVRVIPNDETQIDVSIHKLTHLELY